MLSNLQHPVLGTLTWNEDLSTWETVIELLADCPVEFSLTKRMDSAPTDDIDALLQNGVELLEWARQSTTACGEQIADKMLDLYNNNWAQDDSTDPMSRTEFIERIAPSSIVRDIDGSGFFYWNDGGMFAGHWIELRFDENQTIFQIGLAG